MSRSPRTIALDFDGVLHRYSGYRGGVIDEPIDGARDAVMRLLARGHTVVVFTTRAKATVEAWLAKYEFPPLEVTDVKRPFWVIVDDRAFTFDGVWSSDTVGAIEKFKPYWLLSSRR